MPAEWYMQAVAEKSSDFEESGIPQAASLQVTWDVLGLPLTLVKQGWGEAWKSALNDAQVTVTV